MAEPDTTNQPAPQAKGFPYLTVLAALATLFAFLGLTVLAYNSPNYLTETKDEPKTDPAVKLNEVKSKNEAILAGSPGAATKMPVSAATADLLGKLKSEKDRLPFPAPEPPQPPPADPKKDGKDAKKG